MKIFIIISLFSTMFLSLVNGQDLFALLDSTESSKTNYTYKTFNSVRLISGYTSETAGKNDLIFSISHRFGPVNGGIYEFYGLDQSTIRFGFEYGVSERLSLGIGRSSYEKLYDGFIKYKITRQSSGVNSFPLTITFMSGMSVKTQEWVNSDRKYPFSARLYYINDIFISRKFNKKFSLQIVPTLVHRNMVLTREEQNLVMAMGAGANYTINNWLSVSGEYYYILPGHTADNFENSLSLGVDIDSGGGHIFQIHISNSQSFTEKLFVPETTGKWIDGDIALGFSIIRVFNMKKNHKNKK